MKNFIFGILELISNLETSFTTNSEKILAIEESKFAIEQSISSWASFKP